MTKIACDDDKNVMIHVPLNTKADFSTSFTQLFSLHNLTLKRSVNLLFGHLKISY